jgi:hypothetical protein
MNSYVYNQYMLSYTGGQYTMDMIENEKELIDILKNVFEQDEEEIREIHDNCIDAWKEYKSDTNKKRNYDKKKNNEIKKLKEKLLEKSEIDLLKTKKINTLKQFALKVHNFAYGTEWDDEDIVSAMEFDEIIQKMMNDEKKLEEQNKKLKEENEMWKKEEIAKLQEDNQEINRMNRTCECPKDKDGECIPMTELEKLQIGYKVMKNSYITVNEKLKKEINKIKEEYDII